MVQKRNRADVIAQMDEVHKLINDTMDYLMGAGNYNLSNSHREFFRKLKEINLKDAEYEQSTTI